MPSAVPHLNPRRHFPGLIYSACLKPGDLSPPSFSAMRPGFSISSDCQSISMMFADLISKRSALSGGCLAPLRTGQDFKNKLKGIYRKNRIPKRGHDPSPVDSGSRQSDSLQEVHFTTISPKPCSTSQPRMPSAIARRTTAETFRREGFRRAIAALYFITQAGSAGVMRESITARSLRCEPSSIATKRNGC
jgi:hypothetical protein